MTTVTVLDGDRAREVEATVVGDRLLLSAAGLRALGWEVHDGLLCDEAMCVPLPSGSPLADGPPYDLAALAAALDRPLALDAGERVGCLGAAAGERARALASLRAPDFTLPDLAGRRHQLSQHRGHKVFLLAWASW